MSKPMTYYGKRSHMSADLKRVAHRVAARHPEMFVKRNVEIVELANVGRFSVTQVIKRVDVEAEPLRPAYRHRLAWER